MAKRKIEIDVSDVVTTVDNAKVHGVITELSPVKLSRKNQKYFSGKITDGKKLIRVLSFEPSLHGAMAKSRKCGNLIPLQIVKLEKLHYVMQVVLRTHHLKFGSQVETLSEKSFDLIAVEKKKCSVVALEDLVNVAVNERVSVCVKVVDLEATRSVKNKYGKEFMMQNVMVADGTAQSRVVLWENEIGKLDLNKSYQLENVAVRVFNDTKHLSFSEGTTITLVENIVEI